MNFVKQARCTLCNLTFSVDANITTCSNCGEKGVLDIEYDYEKMKDVVTLDYFKATKLKTMWRYKPLMSVDSNYDAETLPIGGTPLIRSKRLAQKLGLSTFYIKDEGMNPTGSLKDRASAVAVVKALEASQSTVACSSTGNAASSLAGNAAHVGLTARIFVPKRAPIGKLRQLSIYGANVYSVQGDYKSAFKLSKAAINEYGWYNRNAAINPHLVEGKKTVAYEIAEELGFNAPDWVVVSVGDGCTIAGVYKGFYDLYKLNLISTMPKLLGVQSEGCAPFVEADQNQRELTETDELTIADSIAVGIPRNPVKAIRAVKESLGAWISVPDQAILDSMKWLGKLEGIFAEPASAAGLAGLIKALNNNIISASESVVLIHTGNGLKDPVNAERVIDEPHKVSDDLNIFKKLINKENKT